MNNLLNRKEIDDLKRSGHILAEAMLAVEKAIRPGISTLELDQVAEKFIRDRQAIPAFKEYFVPGSGAYPASVCVSINEQIVHGLPKCDVWLKEGDIVSIDIGVSYHGLCTDMAKTFPVGIISSEAQKIIDTTRACLETGIRAATSGSKIGQIGLAVQTMAEKEGFGVIRELVGHGVGRKVHLPPQIPNFGDGKLGPVITEGMALAIEPMLAAGDYRIKMDPDGWSIATYDGSLAAHFEHTVVIENGQTVVVTQ